MIARHSTRLSQAHEDEDDLVRTADRDYPELGTILTDRPDPGSVITVIGSKTAAAYGTEDDARDHQYNGGPGDSGLYWAGPGEQSWQEEHAGPQEEAPPPPWMMSPVMARLAELEEAADLIGMSHHATTINGQQVDDHGDAPEHGQVPRAGDPDSYDDRSTEGEGDPKWSQALPWGDKKAENGATVGMYPEAMSAGGGPGLEIGAFTASRVPWTGKERGTLHRWQDVPTGTWGDFVPSPEFRENDPAAVTSGEPAGETGITAEASAEDEWKHHLREGHGWGDAQFEHNRLRGNRLDDMHAAMHEAGLGNHSHAPENVPEHPEQLPEQRRNTERILSDTFGSPLGETPGMQRMTQPGKGGEAGGDPLSGIVRSEPSHRLLDPEHWRTEDPPRFRRMMNSLIHVTISPDDAADFQDDEKAAPEKHPHDDDDDSLDAGPDNDPDNPPDNTAAGIGKAQLSQGDPADISPDNPSGTVRDRPDASGIVPDPGEWPLAGAATTERNRAYTQGRDDGKVKRNTAAHLEAFTAAAGSPEFRFEFTAAWTDVIAKAKRIRAEGHVRITHASQGMVIGEVRGDHDTYESGLQRPVGHRQSIQHWACGCPWASFHQDRSLGTRYAGRPCSHVMALQFEAQSKGMFGRQVAPDEALPSWSPNTLVVKSYPPFEGEPHRGRWREEWRAPVTVPARTGTLRRTAEMFCPACGDDRDDAGRCYGCGTVTQDQRESSRRTATPDEARNWNWSPEDRDEWERSGAFRSSTGAVPEQDCLYRHDGPCPVVGGGRTGESLRHKRPKGFWSEHAENPDFDPLSRYDADHATHVLTGYIGPHEAGTLHYSRSDDGVAHHVEMLHSTRSGTGVASALMDDLYSHVKRSGGWLDHGQRTPKGNDWWAQYREPHPEVSTHNAHPSEGWARYFQPREVAEEMQANRENSGGRGTHADRAWDHNDFPEHDRGEEWSARNGYEEPEWGATAALLRAGEDPAEVGALRLLTGLALVTADQANAPWGSDNTVSHPPQKPYGATSAPDKDMDPGSYGPLAGPDPANWGGIDEGSVFQMPLSNTASKGISYSHSSGDGTRHVFDAHDASGKNVGYATADESPGGAFIDELYVHPDYRGRGIGRQLLGNAVGHFPGRQVSLKPDPYEKEDAPAQGADESSLRRLYDSFGFQDDPSGHMTRGAAHQVLVPGGAHPVPGDLHWPDLNDLSEDQGTFGYSDRASTAGPSTAMSARDPQGIRMEEARGELHDEPEAALPSTTGDDLEATAAWYHGTHHDIPVGSHVETGHDPNYGESEEHVYFTGSPEAATGWAHGSMEMGHRPGDVPRVYEVEPTGPFERDPTGENPGESGDHRSAYPLLVTAEVPVTHERHYAAADGTIGGGSAGDGTDEEAPLDTAALGEFGAAYQPAGIPATPAPTAMGDQSVAEGLSGGAQQPSMVTQEPGMGSQDDVLGPEDQSIQTIGNQQWSGGGADSDETAVPAGQPQGSIDDIVASFQRSAAARGYSESARAPQADGDIAAAARAYLSKTAEVLPKAEADALIREGRGQQARNLDLLDLGGTHYEDDPADEDDVMFA